MQEIKLLIFINFFLFIMIKYLKKKKKKKTKEKSEKEESEEKEDLDKNKFFKYIENVSQDIYYELFKDYFKFVSPTVLTKQLFETKDKNKIIKFVNVINSKLRDVKDEIEKMSKQEIEIEKPNKILNIVKEIIVNSKFQILTPNQMLSRLPITLAQLNA